MGAREYNARQVELYLDNFDRVHRSAAGSEVPAGKEAKGMRQFVAPISEKGFLYIDDAGNREAATLLSPIFARMRRERFDLYYACGLVAGWYVPQEPGLGREEAAARERSRREREAAEERERKKRLGFRRRLKSVQQEQRSRREGAGAQEEAVSEEPPAPGPREPGTPRDRLEAARAVERELLARRLERTPPPGAEEPDHGILRRWKAGADQGYQEDADALAVFRAACSWAAERLPEGVELDVHAPGGRPAKTPGQAAAMDREENRRKGMARAHRLRYRDLLAIERRYPDATREAAKSMWSEKYGMSVPAIRDSIRFCEKHEWPDGSTVEPRFRWPGGEGAEPRAG